MTTNGPQELVPLGEGPVATVYAGVRPDTGEAFALKVFPAKLPKRTRAELDRELTRLAGLRDRAPVLVPEAVEETPDGRTALRMELCSQSLRELIASCGKLSVPDALALGRAVATALAEAHRVGLVHGGVTPGNLLFRPTGEPVLADLGLTLRRAYPRDHRGGIDYTAPETLRDGTVDERSDLYGLGALLHLALTGESPHPGTIGEPEGERMLRVLSTPVPPLNRPEVPEPLVAVVSALLSKDPALRPAEASVVAGWLARLGGPEQPEQAAPVRGFDDFAGTLPTPATPAPPPAPATEKQSPRPSGAPLVITGPARAERPASRTGLILGGIGVAAVLAVGAVLLISEDPAELPLPPGPAPAAAPTTSSPKPVEIVLEEPVVRGDTVELRWRSSEPLYFAVSMVAEGEEKATTSTPQKTTTWTSKIDPSRKYCFDVRGTNGNTTYQSKPKSINQATCRY